MAKPVQKKQEQLADADQPLAQSESLHESAILTLGRRREQSGPLPSPEALAAYEKAIPGLALRIVEMAEAEQKQRHAIGHTALSAQIKELECERGERRRAQYLAFSLGTIITVGGCVAVCMGHDAAGATIVTATLVGMITAFIYGRSHVPLATEPSSAEGST